MTLRAAGVGGHVTPIATIPLTLAATDDFGLAALRIQADRSVLVEEKDKPEQKIERSTIKLPFESDPARPTLDHQIRHDLSLQSDPPKVGTILRFTGEADDRCARGVQTGRSSVLAFQVVSADELFYEILIRQRAERTKFLSVLETAEKNDADARRLADGRGDHSRDADRAIRARGSSSRSPAGWPTRSRR